jgi:acetyl esterase/lipase
MKPASDIAAAVDQIRTALHTDFAPRAERARSRWPVTITEAEIAGVSCQVVRPATGGSGATLLYLFGGGYVSGSPEYELPAIAALASLGALKIIAPRYALAPEHSLPRALDQCLALYRALSDQGGSRPLYIGGESAGGGLALALTRLALEAGLHSPDALVLFSPWSDLTPNGIEQCEGIDDPTITPADLRICAQAYLGETPPTDPRASPGVPPFPNNWPDTFLSTGTRDILRHSVLSLAARLSETDARLKLIDAENMWHAFELYDEFPQAENSLRDAVHFVTASRET